MSTAVINIKVNKDLKYEAQILAEELGLSLSALINICLKKIVRTRVIELNAAEKPSDYMIKALKESKEDIKAGRVISFKTPTEVLDHLDKLIEHDKRSGRN